MNSKALIALFFLATTTFAQHGGSARGGPAAGVGRRGGVSSPPGPARRPVRFTDNRTGSRQRFGTGFFAPYYPFGGDYSSDLLGYDQPAGNDYLRGNNLLTAEPAPALAAHGVVNEYQWKDEGAAGGDQSVTFTIALKDGTRRYPVATWLQNGKLNYIDTEGRQEVLSSDRIDRSATRRLNNEKKLYIQLPPG